ncbi:MAG: FeoB-associated Cys-rich membrane protein [Desulfosarcina sp.]|jgi:hypothetical protein
MQTIIVIIIVAIAAVYVGRIFLRGFKQEENGACGCTACPSSDSCTQPSAGDCCDAPSTQSDR